MNKNTDVLIVGGGIIGLACAYYLQKAGRQVRIIEQDSIGAGAARQYLKTPLAESTEEQWVGMRPVTYDDLPIIDWAPRQSNLILATGHGMMGISMAPSTGALVAELITGADPHIDPAPYSIRRL
jgi:D-amino-acid dehydrogenase